jgi:7,8-dihydropterin-6-yl-methyl-4-(beta-D-ribofuranosyl)aminobenzene 5'-phosphate synthase
MLSLVELDALEVVVIVDNEVDPISKYEIPDLTVSGQMKDVAIGSPFHVHDRGNAIKELRMDALCCGAHGLSLIIVRPGGHWLTLCLLLRQQ